jgi:hypothetical protein
MRISYSRIWEDTVRLIRTHASLAAALAGVFLFLPSLLMGHFVPMPEVTDSNELFRVLGEHFRENFHWVLLSAILSAAGTLAILMLVFRGGATSVGAAIAAAFGLLVPYFVAVVLTGIPVAIGLILLILPGLYLMARFLPLGAVMVAEGERSSIGAIRRTWAVTKGHGWAILGLFLLIFVAGLVLMSVIGTLIGLVLHFALPEGLAKFMSLIVSTAASTALQVVTIFLYAAIYRALTGPKSAESAAPAAAAAGTATVRSDHSAD